MSFALFLDKNTPAFGSGTSLIKAKDRQDFETVVALLSETRRLNESSKAEIATLHETAEARGYEEGLAKATAEFDSRLAELALQFDAFREERRDDIAAAAFAAVKAIIGDLDDERVIIGLVDASLSRRDSEAPVTIEVAPAMVESLQAHLADRTYVSVRANDAFGPYDCGLLTPQGRIVADLDVQLGALSDRWGVTDIGK